MVHVVFFPGIFFLARLHIRRWDQNGYKASQEETIHVCIQKRNPLPSLNTCLLDHGTAPVCPLPELFRFRVHYYRDVIVACDTRCDHWTAPTQTWDSFGVEDSNLRAWIWELEIHVVYIHVPIPVEKFRSSCWYKPPTRARVEYYGGLQG